MKIYVFVFVKLYTIVNALALVVVLLKIDYTHSLILIYERWLVAERNWYWMLHTWHIAVCPCVYTDPI